VRQARSHPTSCFASQVPSQLCITFIRQSGSQGDSVIFDTLLHKCGTIMSWYRISFRRSEASTKIADLAQDFIETLVSAGTDHGIGMYRQQPINGGDQVVYFICLNTARPSRHLIDVYGALPCTTPSRHDVEHFAGDPTLLGLEKA
jgi:hypothetical protein